jgi:hypothetical protein
MADPTFQVDERFKRLDGSSVRESFGDGKRALPH